LGTGDATRLDSPFSLSIPPPPPPPPLLLVSPDDIVKRLDVCYGAVGSGIEQGEIRPQWHAAKTGLRIAMHEREIVVDPNSSCIFY
jgi:hypothetical protein